MGVLEQVMELKNKGVSDNEIIGILKEKGNSPKAISDALGQAKIKDAINSSKGENDEEMEPSVMGPERAEELPTEGSISDEDLTPLPSGIPSSMQQRSYVPLHQEADEGVGEEEYIPQPQTEYSPQQYAPQQQYPAYQQQEYMPQEYTQQEYIPQEGYEYQPSTTGVTDTDSIIEISEQVFADKMKGVLKHLESLNEFKTLSSIKIDNISERLKRIELSIDRLQIAILEKIGSYGRGIDTLKKEMDMVQNSFSKVVNTVAEKSGKPEPERRQQQNMAPATNTVQRIEKKTTVVHKSMPRGKTRSKNFKK